MYGLRLLRLIAFLIVASLFGTVLAAEDVIELSAGCTLYYAIVAANTDTESGACPAGRGADTIRLTAEITLERELPPIVSTISIEGEGYSISGDDQFRIFHVDKDGALSIRDLLLTQGFAKRGGAILNDGRLSVVNSRLNKNASERGGSAIYNAGGALTVDSSTFFGNLSKYGTYEGGAIANRGDATISRTLFTHNESPKGSAINNHGDMRISQSTLAANVGEYGGTIDNRGWLTIEQSSINDNVSEQTAGILSQGPTSRLVISNSTISGNRAVADRVGMTAYSGGISAFGTVILTHVTIVNNVSEKGGGIYRLETMGGLVILRNSIVAGNSPNDCAVGLHEQTNSIIGDGSCDARINGDPLLERVEVRYEPLAGSPAIGAGDPRYCALVDQVGKERPPEEPCDIGAIEASHAKSPSSNVKKPRPTPGKCTFEDEIIAANTDAPYGACPAGDGADIIVYKGAYPEEPLPVITSDITIVGNGGTIQPVGRDAFPLFEVLGGHLRLRNLTLRGGYSPWTGGMIAVLKGKLTLEGVTIRDSSAVIGGAIFNDHGDVTIVDSRFINNRAEYLGGWYTGLGGAIYNSGTLHIHNSIFSANSAEGGGAVFSEGDGSVLEIGSSRFSSNTSISSGGAISNRSRLLYIDQSVFMDNAAIGDRARPPGAFVGVGGAVSSNGEIEIRNSTFSRNRAARGGAIYLSDADATLSHITVVGDSRSRGAGIYSEAHPGGGIKLTNSLIAGNSGYEYCLILPIESLKLSVGNFIEDGSCDADLQGDPLPSSFDALANMITLQADSPAIDAGDPDYCLPFDQLGRARTAGDGCDIGAIEFIPVDH